MLGRELSDVPVYFVGLAARGEPPSDEDKKLLLDYVSVSSWLAEYKHGKGRFIRVAEAPGYLRVQVGKRGYFVPYGLVSVFPNETQLNSVDQLVCTVRLSPSSAFCLSGSGVFIGQVTCVSDIDFCEYFLKEVGEIKELLAEMIQPRANNQLVRVKVADKRCTFPFEDLENLLGAELLSCSEGAELLIKLDFVARSDLFDIIAATNVVLPTDLGFTKSENLRRSFQYQEAVIFEGLEVTPKRPLIDPEDFGRYLNWLRQEVRNYASQSREAADSKMLLMHGSLALKALKRALSWFLMVGLSFNIENIVAFLRQPDMVMIAKITRLQEVSRLLDLIDPAYVGDICHRLSFKASDPPQAATHLKDFFGAALELAENLLQEIDELISQEPQYG